jgi:hypothetical protein
MTFGTFPREFSLIAHCSLLIAYCLLLTAYCLLLTAYCLLRMSMVGHSLEEPETIKTAGKKLVACVSDRDDEFGQVSFKELQRKIPALPMRLATIGRFTTRLYS